MSSEEHQGPAARVVDGLKAIAMGLLAQLLMFGLEMAMELTDFPFPSSILAMFVLSLFLLGLGCFWDGFEHFYNAHLRRPANLLNRHMSIGFSVPIVMLARHPVASGDTIARIIACFIIAGILSAVMVYLLATCTQRFLGICARHLSDYRRGGRLTDEEAARPVQKERANNRHLSVILGKPTVYTSQVSSVVSFQDLSRSSNGYSSPDECRDTTPSPPPTSTPPTTPPRTSPLPNVSKKSIPHDSEPSRPFARKLFIWATNNPLLVLCWSATLLITIPLRHAANLEAPLGISLLLSLWTSILSLQAAIKSSPSRILQPLKPKLRTTLSVICNPVLWTALGLLAYTSAESHRSNRPVGMILSTLEQNTTFTDLVMHRTPFPEGSYFSGSPTVQSAEDTVTPYSSRPIPKLAAGDVANAILSAGLVCWGLKLWEYRKRLLSSAGFTILLVSSVAALVNVIAGPLLAREVLGPRSQAGYDLAFVARSVTLALGAPAVARLGGDVGLNAAMVVVNGIVAQMVMGLGVGGWVVAGLEGVGRGVKGRCDGLRLPWGLDGRGGGLDTETVEERQGKRGQGISGNGHGGLLTPPKEPTPAHTQPRRVEEIPTSQPPRRRPDTAKYPTPTTGTSVSTIAAGVTVGINAAAMGTAQLYESGSDAAPYAALAMTVFGVATVGFTMVAQLGEWVVMMVE